MFSSPHSWRQKIIAFSLIFVLLSSNWLISVGASTSIVSNTEKTKNDLVVLLVDQNLFTAGTEDDESSITGKIYRYARDIKQNLNQTKTLIITVPNNTKPIQIADTLENLYYDGDNNDFEENHLVGVILIGNIPLPELKLENQTIKSIAPYTDFFDKAYIYSPDQAEYIEHKAEFSPEIWHGIFPNFSNSADLEAFLDYNHQYYAGEIDITRDVFYADFIEEASSISSTKFDLYKNTLKYTEDIAYKRFTNKLLKKLNNNFADSILSEPTSTDELLEDVYSEDDDNEADAECAWGDSPSTDDVISQEEIDEVFKDNFDIPDLYAIEKVKKFLPEYYETITTFISKVYKNVTQSGRWLEEDVQFLAKDISLRDIEMRKTIKRANDLMKDKITDLVATEWQLPVSIITSELSTQGGGENANINSVPLFSYGRKNADIKEVEECTWYRGTPENDENLSQMIAMNRTYDVNAIECGGYAGCCIRNQGTPESCEPKNATQIVSTVAGSILANYTQPISFADCLYYKDGPYSANYTTNTISSLYLHDEPRNSTINSQIDAKLAYNLPVDDFIYLNFQNKDYTNLRIDFPNLFEASGDSLTYITEKSAVIKAKYQQTLDYLEEEIPRVEAELNRLKRMGVNPDINPDLEYQIKNLEFRLANLPMTDLDDDFLTSLFTSSELDNLDELIDWQNSSLDEKYQDTLQTLFDNQTATKSDLLYLRGLFSNNQLITQVNPEANETDLMAEIWENDALNEKINEDTTSDESEEDQAVLDDDECGSYEGVEVWEWPAAVICWLKSLKNFKVDSGIDDYDNGFKESFEEFDEDNEEFNEELEEIADLVENEKDESDESDENDENDENEADNDFDLSKEVNSIKVPSSISVIKNNDSDVTNWSTISMQLEDSKQQIYDGFAEITVDLPAGIISNITDINNEVAGLQLAVISGQADFKISLSADNNLDSSTIKFSLHNLQASTSINVLESVNLSMKILDSVISDNKVASKLQFKLDKNYQGTAILHFITNNAVYFPESTLTLINGQGESTVAYPVSSQTLSFKVQADILNEAIEFSLPGKQTKASQFLIDKSQYNVKAGESVAINIKLADDSFTPMTIDDSFQLFVTPDSTKYITSVNGITDNNQFSQTIQATNGLANINLTTNEQTGVINLALMKKDSTGKHLISPQFITIKTGLATTPLNVNNLSSVFTYLVQEGSGDISQFIEQLLKAKSLVVAHKAPLLSDNNEETTQQDGQGWQGNDASIILTAGRVPVGKAFMSYQRIQDFLWGDPVFMFTQANNRSDLTASGYDKTVGDKIFTTDADIAEIKSFDYNNDNFTDILLRKSSNTLVLLEGTANNNFIKRWDYASLVDGINNIATGDFMSDKYDDILLSSNEGKIYLFNNKNGYINADPSTLSINVDHINQLAVHDFDKDKIPDLLVSNSRGELVVYYGSASGFSDAKIIKSWGVSLNLDNAGSDLKITDFTTPADLLVYLDGEEYKMASKKDQNNDNFYDLLLVKSSDSNINVIAYGNAQGEFSFIKSYDANAKAVYESVLTANNAKLTTAKTDVWDPIYLQITDTDKQIVTKKVMLKSFLLPYKYYSYENEQSNSTLDLNDTVKVNIQVGVSNIKNGDFIIDTIPNIFNFIDNSVQCTSINATTNKKESIDCKVQILDGNDNKIAIGPLNNLANDVQIAYELETITTPNISFSIDQDKNQIKVISAKTIFTPNGRNWTESTMPANGNCQTDDNDDNQADNENSDDVDIDEIMEDMWDSDEEDEEDEDSESEEDFQEELNEDLEETIDKIENLNCMTGGCLSLPLNKAFLVPGTSGVSIPTPVNGPFSGTLDQVIDKISISVPTNIFGVPAFGIHSVICPAVPTPVPMILPCSGVFCYNPMPIGPCWSNPAPIAHSIDLRFYISPTLTGGIGMALCKGQPTAPLYMSNLAIAVADPTGKSNSRVAKCIAFAPPLPYDDVCDKINESMEDLSDQAFDFTSSAGKTLFNVDGAVKNVSENTAEDFTGLTIPIEVFDRSATQNENKSTYPFFKGFLERWWDAQKREFLKGIDLPNITLYYPEMDEVVKIELAEFTEAKNEFNQKNEDNKDNNKTEDETKTDNKDETLSEKAESLSNQAKKMQSDIENQFNNIFDVVENIPFLVVKKERIDLEIPWINPHELTDLIEELENWYSESKTEVDRFKNLLSETVAKCQSSELMPQVANSGLKEDTKTKLNTQICGELQTMEGSLDFTSTLSAVEKNIKILKSYRDFPQQLAKYKSGLAYYFADALNFINDLIEVLGGWFKKNKIIAEKYVQMYYTIMKILKLIKDISFIYEDYTNYSTPCHISPYSQDFTLYGALTSLIPQPPVIKLPKLPDVVLDLSHVEAGIELVIPELNITTKELSFYFDLDPIRLPKKIDFGLDLDFNLDLPKIPELPAVPELPELPEFPSLPLPKLPNLPPPPKLPSVQCLSKWTETLKLILKLYNLIKEGMWVYPESKLTKIIEALTNRATSPMLPVDFLQLQWPDITYPTIDEIKVDTYLNIEPDLSIINNTVKSGAETIEDFSDQVNNSVEDAQSALNDKLNDINNQMNKCIDDSNSKFNGIINMPGDTLDNLEDEVNDWSNDKENQIEDNLDETVDLQSELPVELKPWQDLAKQLQNLQLAEMKSAVILQNTNNILALNEVKPYNMPILADADTDLNNAINNINQNIDNIVDSANDQINSNQQNLNNTTKVRKGLYLFNEDTCTKESLLSYTEISDQILDSAFIDYDQDGDDDIFYSVGSSLYLKKAYDKDSEAQLNAVKMSYSQDPQIGDLSNYLPEKRAVNDVLVQNDVKQTTITWLDEVNNNIGYILEKKSLVSGFDYHRQTESDYIFLLKDVNLETEKKYLGPAEITVSNNTFYLKDKETAITTPFLNSTYNWQLDNKFYYLKVKAINEQGKPSVSSRQFLLSPQNNYDDTDPILIDNDKAKVPVLKEWPVSAGKIYDDNNLTYYWQTKPTVFVGNEYLFPATEQLGTKNIKIIAEDSSGNKLPFNKAIQIYAPNIIISSASKEEIHGYTEPNVPLMPFAFIRTRNNKAKLIFPQNDKQRRFRTDVNGKFIIQQDDTHRGWLIRDKDNENLAFIDPDTGTIELFNDQYKLEARPSGQNHTTQIAIINSLNQTVALVNYASLGETVITATANDFADSPLNQVSVLDHDENDSFKLMAMPSNSKYFVNGYALVGENKEVFVAISPSGAIRFLNQQLKLDFSQENDKMIFLIKNSNNDILAKIFIGVSEKISVIKANTQTNAQLNTFSTTLPTTNFWHNLFANTYAASAISVPPRSNPNASSNANSNINFNANSNNLALPFTDLNPNHPYYQAIVDLYHKNILKGYTDGSFQADAKITRAEFVKIALGSTICLDCTIPDEETKALFQAKKPFPDVNLVDWFYYCISIAKAEKMVTGYGDGLFHPNKNISRKEAVAILLRQIKANLTPMPVKAFIDVPEYDWAKDYVFTAVQMGLIKNIQGQVFPNEEISRGEFAMMASRVLNYKMCQVSPVYNDTNNFLVGRNEDNNEKPLDTNINDQGELVSNFPDGATQITDKNGNITIKYPDGRVVELLPNGKNKNNLDNNQNNNQDDKSNNQNNNDKLDDSNKNNQDSQNNKSDLDNKDQLNNKSGDTSNNQDNQNDKQSIIKKLINDLQIGVDKDGNVVTIYPDGSINTNKPDGTIVAPSDDNDNNIANKPLPFAGICAEFANGLCPYLPESYTPTPGIVVVIGDDNDENKDDENNDDGDNDDENKDDENKDDGDNDDGDNDEVICIFIDNLEDFLVGDTLEAIILSSDDTKVFSKSSAVKIK